MDFSEDYSTSFATDSSRISGELLSKYLEDEGFGDHHIEVYDNWIFRSAYNNVYGKALEFPDKRVVHFENLRIFHPRYSREGKILPLTPKLAREQGVTYGSDWHVDLVLKKGEQELDRKRSVCIGTIPTMLKSRNCVLHGKTSRELALFGEDPKDPGGYFVVAGVEKVILLQEQLTVNKILLMKIDAKVPVVARMTANTPRGTALIELALDKKTKTILKMRFPSMRLKPSEKYKSINVLRIFRLLGIENIDKIREMIGLFIPDERKKKCMFKLARSVLDFQLIKDDVSIIAEKIEKKNLSREAQMTEINRVFESDLFPHLNGVSIHNGDTREDRERHVITSKLYLLSIMVARLLENLAGYRSLDNRDSWSNKRVEGAGRMMEQLFRKAWRKTLRIIQSFIRDEAVKNLTGIVEKLHNSMITETFSESFGSQNWGVKGSQMKNNVAQTLVRDSVVATFAHINTVDVGISRTDRQQSIRMVQNDQWALICPVSTPEGNNAGLLKNLAQTAKVSLERSDVEIIRLAIGDRQIGIEQRVDLYSRDFGDDKLMINGKFMGWCHAKRTKDFFVDLRRNGEISPDISFIIEDDWLYVDMGPSRLVSPLLIVDEDTQQLAIDRLNMRGQSNHTLLTSGAMEYMSAWEKEYIKIATSVDVIRKRTEQIEDANDTFRVATDQFQRISRGEKIMITVNGVSFAMSKEESENRLANAREQVEATKKNAPYTHCELHPSTILGVAASLIPWPNHNQAPRNTYQVSMGKQALGIYHSNHLNRFDGKIKILAFPNRPILETITYKTLGLDERGPGENVNIAFMAFPYTEEDSFVFKKEFLDAGGFRIYKYLTYKAVIRHSGDVIETLTKPEPRPGEPQGRYKYIQMGEPGNPNNGLPMIGAPLRQGDCVIGKVQHVPSSREMRNDSVILRIGDEGIVDKVLVKSDNKTTVVYVKLRVMRVPQEGDKFAPRNAQKGTIGLVMSDIDLPMSDEGIVPDIIINPSCFVGDTPVLMKNGLSRRLVDMKYDGGDEVWSLDTETEKPVVVKSKTVGWESKGVQSVVEVTMEDGRKIRCTETHKFPVIDENGELLILPIIEVNSDMRLMCTFDGILDVVCEKEKSWSLDVGDMVLRMDSQENRDKTLAFMRLLGHVCTDGSISLGKRDNSYSSRGSLGSRIDAEQFVDDIEVLTNKRPTIADCYGGETGGSVFGITIPNSVSRQFGTLDDMIIGRKTANVPKWPAFLFDESCPTSVIREFVASAFGGDGWCPHLMTNKQDGQGTVTFNPPAFSQSSTEENIPHLIEKMRMLGVLLSRVGVNTSRVDKPKKYINRITGKEMFSCTLQVSKGIEFGERVGFRYCTQKSHRLAAYQSYMRFLHNVKRQNDAIIARTNEIYDNRTKHVNLNECLETARLECVETPLNDYYSEATPDQVKNRRRPNRFSQLNKWDYSKIDDAEKYLRRIGALHWFRNDQGNTEGVDYIVGRNDAHLPYFYLKVNDIRDVNDEEVYDLGVAKTHTLVVSGLGSMNCLPSRMTVEYVMELLVSKSAAFKGSHVNGGAFEPFDMKGARETLKEYDHNEFGYEEMRSGTSGKKLFIEDSLIYTGPVFFQALKHHAIDKVQARGTGQVKPMTRQPHKGLQLSPCYGKTIASLITLGNTFEFRENPNNINETKRLAA